MSKNILMQAITAAQQGKLIIYPTDTQYALGCTLKNKTTIKKIYELKKRPKTLPLPIAVSSIEELSTVAYTTVPQIKIAQQFLPGPLTMVLKKHKNIPQEVTGSNTTIAVRIPNHPITLSLLKETGPLIITSANIHGQKPYEDIKDIQNQFKETISAYVPGGTLNMPPSTIIDFTTTPLTLLRQGPISLEEIINEMTQ
jgi:L-threonylcarbamoyladenylate synthase